MARRSLAVAYAGILKGPGHYAEGRISIGGGAVRWSLARGAPSLARGRRHRRDGRHRWSHGRRHSPLALAEGAPLYWRKRRRHRLEGAVFLTRLGGSSCRWHGGHLQWHTQEFSKDQGITLRGASRSAGAPSAGHWREGRRHWREGAVTAETGATAGHMGAAIGFGWRGAIILAKEAPSPAGRSCFFNEVPDDYHVLNDVCNGPSRSIHINSVMDPVVAFILMLTIAILINYLQIIDMRSAVALISFFFFCWRLCMGASNPKG